jgi:hypothetical protein
MQEFYINKGSILPTLRMDLIDDGRHTFWKFNDAVQAADITFTMVNMDTGLTKIAKAPAYIKLREIPSCDDEYCICYDWKERDTKEAGLFKGMFDINFNELKHDEVTYPTGLLKMPIREELMITIL